MTVFVQQFVTIDRPPGEVADRFEQVVVPKLADLIAATWRSHADGVSSAPSSVSVGARRDRVDGVAYAIRWPANGEIGRPEVDIDLEFSDYDADATHAQVAGQVRFPWLVRWSSAERAAERRTMTAIDDLLCTLASALEPS
jgi:hypothetical protein